MDSRIEEMPSHARATASTFDDPGRSIVRGRSHVHRLKSSVNGKIVERAAALRSRKLRRTDQRLRNRCSFIRTNCQFSETATESGQLKPHQYADVRQASRAASWREQRRLLASKDGFLGYELGNLWQRWPRDISWL